MPHRPLTPIALALALALAGCGGSSTGSSTALPRESKPATSSTSTPASHGQTVAPAASGGVTAPSSPSGEASLTVTPLTVAPGRTLTVLLRAPAGTRQAIVTLAGAGGSVSVPATAGARGFEATLVVPRGLRGGFWPLVARYGSSSLSQSISTEVKVFTP